MKTHLALAAVLLLSTFSLRAEEPEETGAEPGVWTQDIDAALAAAKEKGFATLINFTGSDWCGWCKVMDRNVYSKEAWETYAKDKLFLVTIDFPKDKSLVPEAYVERNKALKGEFGVRGFPTYILVDADGETQLGRLGSGRDKTPESFITEVERVLRFSAAGIAAYTSSLEPEAREEYESLLEEIRETEEGISEANATIAEAHEEIEELKESVAELKDEATAFRAEQAGPETLAEYEKVKADLETVTAEWKAWLATSPARNEESQQKRQKMMEELRDLKAKLAEF